LEISPATDPEISGDEPLILARRTGCPVVISPNRVEALEFLLKNHGVDIVISDDGLQHYSLERAMEIVIVDGERGFGNQCCLPMGPLREPLSRLNSVDFMVINQNIQTGKIHEWLQKFDAMIQKQNIYEMTVISDNYYNIAIPELNATSDDFAGQPVHGVAGIGNPRKFFDLLVQKGLAVLAHEFPDHHVYRETDFHFNEEKENKIIMTEKDAVKCEKFADYRYWYLPISAQIPLKLGDEIVKSLQSWNVNS
jgi:tetraacyldisaccharide 4'-kinase